MCDLCEYSIGKGFNLRDPIKTLHVDEYERLFKDTTKSEKQMSSTHASDLCEIFNKKTPDSGKHNDLTHAEKICKLSDESAM